MKESLKKIPLAQQCYRLLREPREELSRFWNYYRFKKEMGDLFQTSNKGGNGRLLVVSLLGNWIEAVKEESFLVKAFQLRNIDCFILTYKGCWANKYYRLFGLHNLVYFDKYLSAASNHIRSDDFNAILHSIKSFQDLMQFKYKDVSIGKYICSSLVRKSYSGYINPSDPREKQNIRHGIQKSMANVIAAKQIYETVQPNMTLFLERGYTPYGEFFDLSLKYGLNTIQWCGSHRDNALTFKRYTSQNADRHPASISEETWGIVKSAELKGQQREAVKKELFENYASGAWFGEVGTQFKARLMDKSEVVSTLELDTGKKTAVIFSHLFWDATFFWGEDLFENYREWYVETVKAACLNNKVNWIVKMHPANLVKLTRDGYKGELVELQAIEHEIGSLPSHVKLLLPDTPISTYSLFSVMDYCLTVRGTIGIEAAVFGIPVFTAGTGRYDNLDFTIDSSSREEYLEKLARIHTYPPLAPNQTELAQKFAYATFILRPFALKTIRISFAKDEKATLNVQIHPRTKEDLLEADDLRILGDWLLNSKHEDYLDKDRLQEFLHASV